MKKVMNEFKEFIMRGNVIDLAVGVIIGGAFQAIVNSVVKDIVTPLIGLLTKGMDFTNKFIVLGSDQEFATLADAQAAGAATLNYGSFITAVINFLIMAVVIFFLVKGINKVANMGKKKEEAPEEEPTTKVCPYCKSEIAIDATKCAHCTSDVE
ncbi:MAG: large conductance mechanosensitive channel protein MscL [Clostridia bacterium]|nr:large conductance mechanosensitive channel protein MscL [Clostridia bacterium]